MPLPRLGVAKRPYCSSRSCEHVCWTEWIEARRGRLINQRLGSSTAQSYQRTSSHEHRRRNVCLALVDDHVAVVVCPRRRLAVDPFLIVPLGLSGVGRPALPSNCSWS